MRRTALLGATAAALVLTGWVGWTSLRTDLREPRVVHSGSSWAAFRYPSARARRQSVPVPLPEGTLVDVPAAGAVKATPAVVD